VQVHTHNTHTHTHTRSSDDADGGSEEGRGFVDEGTTSLRHGGHTKGGLGGVSGGGGCGDVTEGPEAGTTCGGGSLAL